MSLALIYAKVPKLECRGLCQECCGPIDHLGPEKEIFEKATGRPFPDPFVVLQSTGLRCPELSVAGQCNAYSVRPLICRLWGVVDVDGMRCPHVCRPTRYLTDDESRRLMAEVDAL